MKLDDSVARKKAGGGDEKIAHKILMMNAAGEELLHKRLYTQKLLHTQGLLHGEVFTQSGS